MTKTLKKGFSLLVVLTMLLSLSANFVFASGTGEAADTLVYTLDPHQFTAYEGQEFNSTNDESDVMKFRKENITGNMISYTQDGLTLTYDVTLDKDVTYMEMLLSYSAGIGATNKTVYIKEGDITIGSTSISSDKAPGWETYAPHSVIMENELSAGEHTIKVVLNGSVNFYGIRFYNYPQKDATGIINPQGYDITNGAMDTDYTDNINDGFRHESNSYGDFVSYTNAGLEFEYKNLYFEENAYYFTIKLGAAPANNANKVNVYIDDVKLENLQTTPGGAGYEVPKDYTVILPKDLIKENSRHDVKIEITELVNLFGFGFNFDYYPERSGLGFINPQSYNVTNGILDDNAGFRHETDATYGDYVSYTSDKLRFEYKNLYFEKAPYDFEVKLGCMYADTKKLNVYIDGVMLDIDTLAASPYWTIPSDYTVVLPENLIKANSAHDVTLEVVGGGVNLFGFGFYAERDGLGFVNPQSYDATNGTMDTVPEDDSNTGFKHESNTYGDFVSFTNAGLKFEYKNLYFEDAPYDLTVSLGAAASDTANKVNLYIDGVKFENLDTSAAGAGYEVPKEYNVVLPEGVVEANTVHDITLEVINGGANLFGFGFYAKKDGFELVNPQDWDKTNGALNETGEGEANVGFRHDTNTYGDFVSYTQGGLTLEYHNVYFEKAPDTLTLYIATPIADGRVSVSLADGTEIGTATTDGINGSYFIPTTYTVDVSGKIAAGSICDLVVKVVDFGVNYFGMQFAAETELITYDAETKIVTINSTPDLAGNLVIIGAYKTGGVLSDIMDDAVTYTEGVPQTINVTEVLDGAEKIKVFIWNNYTQISPVTKCEEFDI